MYRNWETDAKSKMGVGGGRLVTRPAPCPGAALVLQSKEMSRHYPSSPVLGVGAVILDGNRVLLVKRGREPLKGQWSIPGGVLELGETLEDGLKREIAEEVGLEIRLLEIVEVFERITRDEEGRVAYHYVLADYLCEAAGGALRAGDDAESAAWFDREEVASLGATEGTPAVIEKAFQVRERISVAP